MWSHTGDPSSLLALRWGQEHIFFLGPTRREARGTPARAGLPRKLVARVVPVPLAGVPRVAASGGSSCKSHAGIAAGPAGRARGTASSLLAEHPPNAVPASGLMLCIPTQRRKVLELLRFFFSPPPIYGRMGAESSRERVSELCLPAFLLLRRVVKLLLLQRCNAVLAAAGSAEGQ